MPDQEMLTEPPIRKAHLILESRNEIKEEVISEKMLCMLCSVGHKASPVCLFLTKALVSLVASSLSVMCGM